MSARSALLAALALTAPTASVAFALGRLAEPAAPGSGNGAVMGAMVDLQSARPVHNLYFTRAAYRGGNGRGGGSWQTDWPGADHTMITVLARLTNVDIFPREHAVRLDDPDLRRYPFLYAVEVGEMNMNAAEIEGLRSYLLAGGFLMVDDFWGSYEWSRFENQIRQVLPEFEIVDLPLDHPIFSTIYQVDEIVQVPVSGSGIYGGQTWENDGIVPHCMGIFDDKGRLLVVINWNTDLGDGWEYAEHPRYPLEYSTYAYRMGANMIFYAMTR